MHSCAGSPSTWRVRRSPHRRGGRVTSPARSTSSKRLRASAWRRFRSPIRCAGRCSAASRAIRGSSAGWRSSLSGIGFSEVYTPSLVERDPDREALRLLEPISAELAVLRTTLLPSLVDAARRNVELGLERIDLFEVARVYLPSGAPLPTERIHVAAIAQGGFARRQGRRGGARARARVRGAVSRSPA